MVTADLVDDEGCYLLLKQAIPKERLEGNLQGAVWNIPYMAVRDENMFC